MKDLVLEVAKGEIENEKFRAAVEKKKQWFRKPWHVRAFPWRIKFKIINLKKEHEK